MEKSSVLVSCCFSDRSENMSSQDSEGESYLGDYITNPKAYGDVDHNGWTMEEEDYDPNGKEEKSSNEDEAPLPQPGDMHVEFKKSSHLDRIKKPKFEFIPFRLLQENKQDLCKKILTLEWEIDDLRDQNAILKRKLREEPKPSTKSTTPPPPPPTKKN